MNKNVKEIFGKYILCLFFSFMLFVVVWLSEIFRYIVDAIASAMSSGVLVLNLFGVFIFFLFVFGFVPLVLLVMFLSIPKLMRAFLATLGVTEELLGVKEKKEEKKNEDTSQNEV